MPRYIALLRAINVGGHVVKMDRLRGLFEELKLKDVATFIASGNVLFDSTAKDGAALESRIERHLEKALGYEVTTFVRTGSELTAVVDSWKGHPETNNLYIGFLKAPLAPDHVARVVALKTKDHEFRVVNREYYWSTRTSLGQSPDTAAALNKTLKLPATVRSITTVRKLAELAEGRGSRVEGRGSRVEGRGRG